MHAPREKNRARDLWKRSEIGITIRIAMRSIWSRVSIITIRDLGDQTYDPDRRKKQADLNAGSVRLDRGDDDGSV